MTKKVPSDAQTAAMIKREVENSLFLTDVINGKKNPGGALGKTLKTINTTKEFDEWLKDLAFLVNRFGGKQQLNIQRLRGNPRDLRNRSRGKK